MCAQQFIETKTAAARQRSRQLANAHRNDAELVYIRVELVGRVVARRILVVDSDERAKLARI